MLSFVATPWIVGPIALTAFFVRRADTLGLAWAFVVIELAAAGSTIAYWLYLTVHKDAQNGIALMFFPVAQYTGILLVSLIIVLIVGGLEWQRDHR